MKAISFIAAGLGLALCIAGNTEVGGGLIFSAVVIFLFAASRAEKKRKAKELEAEQKRIAQARANRIAREAEEALEVERVHDEERRRKARERARKRAAEKKKLAEQQAAEAQLAVKKKAPPTTKAKPKPKPKPAPMPSAAPPRIVTRTSENVSRVKLVDPYKDGDKAWTREEDRALLIEYSKGNGLAYTAAATVIDQRQVAIRLTRLLLNPDGDLNDEGRAGQNRRAYRAGEKQEILEEYRAGKPLNKIADEHGRTLLAIGWQILDNRSYPIRFSRQDVDRLLKGLYEGES